MASSALQKKAPSPPVPVRRVIEERALFHRDEPAVIDRDGSVLSWRELNARANELADQLCKNGAGPNNPVGLTGPDGATTVIGWLAALKADAPVVPLGDCLDDGEIRKLANTSSHLIIDGGSSEKYPGIPTIHISLDGPAPSTPNLRSLSRSSDTVFLTAGTLQISHNDLNELVRWQAKSLDPVGTHRVCSLLTTSSLAGLRIIASTFALGGTVSFSPIGTGMCRKEPNPFTSTDVTRLFVTADDLDVLSTAVDKGRIKFDQLRDLIVVGGTLRLTPPVIRLAASRPDCRLHTIHCHEESASIGACTLELPFAAPPADGAHPENCSSEIHQAGDFAARIVNPAVA